MNEKASMDQLFLEKVHEAIENNLANKSFGVDELAHEIGISRSQLHRRLRFLTGQAASQMIREARLKRAFEMLQNKVGTASEISYQVGFSSPSYFNTSFNKYFGYSPGKVKPNRSSGFKRKYSISLRLIIISLATLLVVASAFILYITLFNRNIESNVARIPDRFIAVLPFKSLSNDPEKQYQTDAVMDAILVHLCKIEDLRVLGRTSVEQYRETDKTAATICHELNVSYLLEGSFQKVGEKVRLIVQLIEPNIEDHIWAETYDRDWKEIFNVQNEVATTVARELEAEITPEEKQLIEKVPTLDLTAYDFYQRAIVEHRKHWLQWNDMRAVERAEDLYRLALKYDSTFADAYVGLANVYWHKNHMDIFSENYLDSMLILADIALSFDDQLAEAYKTRGDYFRENNFIDQAIIEYNKALNLNSNAWDVYLNSSLMYDDEIKVIENLLKAASLHKGFYLPSLYRRIGIHLSPFSMETSYYYLEEALKLDDDSVAYYSTLSKIEESDRSYEEAIEFRERVYAIDSTRHGLAFFLGLYHSFLGQFEESLEYMKVYDRRLKALDRPDPNWYYRIGVAYWMNGFIEEGTYYINTSLEQINDLIKVGRHVAQDRLSFYHSAAMYAFLGEKDKAFENLRSLNQKQRMPKWQVANIKDDPMFDSLRDEPEFQQIVRDIEAKYQAEHKRVRQWLEENEML